MSKNATRYVSLVRGGLGTYLVDIFGEGICHNISLNWSRADQCHSNVMLVHLHAQCIKITLQCHNSMSNLLQKFTQEKITHILHYSA